MLLITFLQNEFINTTVLPDKKKGRYKLNHSIEGFNEDINIDGHDGKWIMASGEQYSIYQYTDNHKERCEKAVTIDSEDVFILNICGKDCTIIAETIKDEKNRFSKFCFAEQKSGGRTIAIGSNPNNDIVLEDKYISGNHAIISNYDDKWFIIDTKSRNGVYVNNRKITPEKEYTLNIGDVVFIVGYKFIICADFIAGNIDFEKCAGNGKLKKVKFREFKRSDFKKKSELKEDYFYRTIELGDDKPDFEEIVLLPPERKQTHEEQSGIISMGSALTMSTASVLVALYSAVAAYYRGTNISYVVPSFIMAGSMVMSSLMWPSIMKKHNKKQSDKAEKERIRDYQNYITQLRDSVRVMKDEEKKYLCQKYLTVEECMKKVIGKDHYLWSKSINDKDFMTVTVGTGKKESSVTIKFNGSDEVFFKDDLRYDMMQFAKEDRTISNVPITLSLNNGCICGISGDSKLAFDFILKTVIQLTSLYSYDELKLIFISDENNSKEWEYTKWLPHVWKSDGSFRYLAYSSNDIKELSAELEKEINSRMTHKSDDFPNILIISTDKKMLESIDIMKVIIKERKSLNISMLTAFGMHNYNSSDYIIELGKESRIYNRDDNTVTNFVPYQISENLSLEQYLDTISNIRLDILTEKYQFPKMLTFLDMFKVSKVEHLNSSTRWAENNPIKSLKTEIGVTPSGDTFFIDMHEKFHGPHGLIAGTTGSGKSESIITMILSLAVNYSPEEVAFVIIDYKGGGLADAFNDVKDTVENGKNVEIRYKLPHVVGTVTNLDGSTIERACISIETELKRRQFLFKTAKKISNDGTMDIYKYQQLRREGAELEALPHLFIVCDEFAELKDDRGDFMELLVSAARIGRSLGIHLVLATQKPDNVVSPQIWSNSRFKICLKVQDKSDSQAVIHCPDAAEISNAGRFFFQVGYNEVFSMGQSAWCGADYIESDDFVKSDVEAVEIISNTGSVLYEKTKKPDIPANNKKHIVSQLIAVRNYLIDIAKDIYVRPLWLEPIPSKLSIRELYKEAGNRSNPDYMLEPIIGKRDDLYNRIQELMTVQFSKRGNIIVYGSAESGIDMFFITLIYSLIYAYTPSQVNIYVLDFDSGFLKMYEKAPHCGDVVTSDDEEDVRNIITSIKNEIVRRSKLFSEFRGEYDEYCKYSGKSLPNIVLILNNYNEFIEKFDCNDIYSLLVYIAREGVKRGVYVVIGTSTTSIRFQLRQYIQQTIMLKMNDVNDYMAILGRTGGITPSGCKGSGIVKENDITYKIQIADIFDITQKDENEDDKNNCDTASEIKALCVESSGIYSEKASSYKELKIDIQTALSESLDYRSLPVGIENNNILNYDFSSKYITFISSLSENSLISFAGYLAKALSRDKNIETVVLDVSGKVPHEGESFRYYSTTDDFERWNEEYKKDSEYRCSKLVKTGDGKYKMSSEEKHVYVIINSFHDVCSINDKNVTFANLKELINNLPEVYYHYIILDVNDKINAERGLYIHIVKNPEDISDFSSIDKENNREWLDDSGIWLGKDFSKSVLFDAENLHLNLSESEAVIIRNRKIENRFKYFQ